MLYQSALHFQGFVMRAVLYILATFQSSFGKYLGSFHVFTVSNSAAVIIFGRISLCPCASFSGKNVEGDVLACRVLDSLAQAAFSLLTP